MASKAEEQKSYEDYCKEAILSLKDRKESGSSENAIEEYIKSNNDVGEDITEDVKVALKAGAESGIFFKNKAGLFKVQKPKATKQAKKPAGKAGGKGGKKKGGKRNQKKKAAPATATAE